MLRPVRAVLTVLLSLLLLGASGGVAFTQDATPEIAMERGVTYGEADGQALLLDVYQPPAGGETSPAVVLLPGWADGRSVMTTPVVSSNDGAVYAIA